MELQKGTKVNLTIGSQATVINPNRSLEQFESKLE